MDMDNSVVIGRGSGVKEVKEGMGGDGQRSDFGVEHTT